MRGKPSRRIPSYTKKNVFLYDKPILPQVWPWASQQSGNGMRQSYKQQALLRQARTFLGDCLACRYAWMSVTE